MGTLTIDLRNDESTFHTTFQDVAAKKSFLQSFLLTDAITSLIELPNTKRWAALSNEVKPDEYYDSILMAIAQHYERTAGDLPAGLDTYKALNLLMEHLYQRGYLRKKLTDQHGEAFYDEY